MRYLFLSLIVFICCCIIGCTTADCYTTYLQYSNVTNKILNEFRNDYPNATISHILLQREGSVNKIRFDIGYQQNNEDISIISYVYNVKTQKNYKHNPFCNDRLSFSNYNDNLEKNIKIHNMVSMCDGDYKILDSISTYENYPDIPIDKKIMEKEIIKENNSFYKIKGCSVENIFSKFKKELKQQYNHIPEYYSVILIEFNYELDMACVYFYY